MRGAGALPVRPGCATQRRAGERARRDGGKSARPGEQPDRGDERRVEDQRACGGHAETAGRLEVSGRDGGERGEREDRGGEREERDGTRRGALGKAGTEGADEQGRPDRGRERDKSRRRADEDDHPDEEPARAARGLSRLEVGYDDRGDRAADEDRREEVGEAQDEDRDVGVRSDPERPREHDVARDPGDTAGDDADADDRGGAEDRPQARGAQFVPFRPSTAPAVRTRIRRSVPTLACVAYQRSNATESSLPSELRPET